MFSNLSNKWQRVLAALAFLLIFLVPVTRNVLGKVLKSNANISGNQSPARGNAANNNSQNSQTVPSVTAPSSGSTASPASNPGPTTNNSQSNNPNPKKPKKK